MAHCINLNHPDIIKFAQEFDLTKEDVGAVIAVWQEDSDEYDRFPSMEEFKSQLTEDITATINLGNRINALRKLNSLQTVPEQQVDIPINEELMQLISPVLEELNSKGNSPLVIGGAVRDALLGKSPKDIDIEIYNTSIEDLNNTLSKYGKVDEVGKSFGILKFTPYKQDTTELVDIEEPFDFSVPRRENKTGTGYQGFSTEFDTSITIEEASSRRDFTWNSIGYNPVNKTLYDYYGGIADLRNGVIRHTTDKFAEDPLRILRAMQFQSRMNHKLAPETAELIKEMVDKGMLDELSKQRIVMEWMKWAVKGSNPQLIFDFLRETGMGNKYFPELMKLRETPQDAEYHPEGDVEVHTRQVLEKAQEIAVREKLDEEEKAVLIFSALFHDVAKPPTTAEMYVEKKGRNVITSRGHEAMGAEMLPDILDRMGITKAISSKVIPLVREHLAHATISGIESEKGQLSAFIKLNDRLEAASIDSLVRLMEADMLGRDNKNAPVPETINTFNSLKERYNAISGGGKKITPLITGKDLISLGFESGPVLGNIVRTALNAQKNLEFTDRDGALSWLNNYLKNEGYEIATEDQVDESLGFEVKKPFSTNIASTIYELIPNITEDKIDEIYNNYVSLMSKARKGKEISKERFKNLLKSYQVFNYKDTYIFGNYDVENGVFITRVNSSPSSKELLAEALPTLVQQGIDFASFVPEDVANKYKRSGYTVSTQGFDYNFKGEDMVKYLAVSNPNVSLKIFNKSLNELSDTEIENYNNSFKLKNNPVEIKGDLIEKAGKDLSNILETYLNQFGIVVKDINEIKNQLNIDELGFADILSKIAYIKDKKDLPPIAGEFIAYMMQYNPLVSDIIKELSQTENYKNLDKSEYFKIIGGLISDDLQNKLEGNYSKSLLQKLKKLIKEFFSLLNNTPVDLINKNIGIISNNILQQNKKLVTASLYKPGAFGKPTKQVSLQEAMESDKFGASIINNLSKKGFILTGSTSLGEQGTIQRPGENLLHDIDWISPFSRQETEKLFKETYPEAIKIRDIYGEGYITDTWIIAPNGYKIKDLVKESDYNIITSYDVINNKGEIVGTYRLIKQQNSNQKEEVVTGIEAKVIDFFSYEKYEQLTPFEKNGIKLANWKQIFKAKLQFARYKDIWDYNRFIPNENTSQITPQQPATSIKEGVEELFDENPELANQVYEALGFKSKPDVILPIGTSGSGKSTFIKSLPQENLVIIEPDAMRVEFTGNMNDKSKDKEIYTEAANRAIKAIKQGKQVVFDTTNLTKEKRLPFIEAIKKEIPNTNIQYKLMELNPELAKQRIKAQLERGENRAAVSDETIDRHAASYKQMLEDIKAEPISNFEITPQQKQQAQQLYSKYLGTIFPDSKIKDIVYHFTTKENKEKILEGGFKVNKPRESDISFSKDNTWKDDYRSETIYSLLNIKNPKGYDRYSLREKKELDPTIDGGINIKTSDTHYATIVFEPEQIYILGSKQDIEGFKEFASAQQQPAIDPTTVYQQLGITFTNDENKPCAANGLTDAVTGTNWKIVKDFAGKPKHSEGGVDITISNDGVFMRRGGKDIKAANGLLIANSTDNTLIPKTDPPNKVQLPEVTVTADKPDWLKYRDEYMSGKPFDVDKYVEDKFNNPSGRGKIDKINPEEFKSKLRNKALKYRYDEAMNYVRDKLVERTPMSKNRGEWLDSFSDKEQEILLQDPRYQSTLYQDTKRGLMSLVEQNPGQTFANILNSSDYSTNEKREMLKDYAEHPIMSKLGDAAKIFSPMSIPTKMVQSAYKDDYTLSDAIKGKKNDAGIIEDIATDPLNLVGMGIWSKLSKAGKFAKLDDAYQALKTLDKVSLEKQIGETLSKDDWQYLYKVQEKGFDIEKPTLKGIEERVASGKEKEYKALFDEYNVVESEILKLKEKEAFYEANRNKLFKDYKDKKITGEEYSKQVKEIQPWDPFENPIFDLENKLRTLKVKQEIFNTPQKNILTSESQLGKNISDGGINNKGVFELGDNYVARLSAHGYDDASRLVNYSDKITSPRIMKTHQVKELNGKVFQVQDKATGIPYTQLSKEEILKIPKKHIDNFYKDIDELQRSGLSIDISGGKSNIFYDPKKGYQFIDLGIGKMPDIDVINKTVLKW